MSLKNYRTLKKEDPVYNQEDLIQEIDHTSTHLIDCFTDSIVYTTLFNVKHFNQNWIVTVSRNFLVQYHDIHSMKTIKRFYLLSAHNRTKMISEAHLTQNDMYIGYDHGMILKFDLNDPKDFKEQYDHHTKKILYINDYKNALVSCCEDAQLVLWEGNTAICNYDIKLEIQKFQLVNDSLYMLGNFEQLCTVNLKVNRL